MKEPAMTARDESGEMIAASQQTGEELPAGVREGVVSRGDDLDSFSATGAIDPDQPGTVNTAAGISVGGTGVGIEPGVDAELGSGVSEEQVAADMYGEER